MDCAEVEARGVAEAYLLDGLTAEEQDAYERHYFECARCYSELEALRAVRDALSTRARPAWGAPQWRGLLGAAAIVAAVAGILMWQVFRAPQHVSSVPGSAAASRPASQPEGARAEDLGRLARFEPPPYSPVQLRGGAERQTFSAAMRRYGAGDYAGAIPLLERAEGEGARFYLGACYLLTGRYRDARAPLEAIGSRPESAYSEEALFLLANVDLKLGESAAALNALDRTIALRGDREQDARALRAQVTAALSRR